MSQRVHPIIVFPGLYNADQRICRSRSMRYTISCNDWLWPYSVTVYYDIIYWLPRSITNPIGGNWICYALPFMRELLLLSKIERLWLKSAFDRVTIDSSNNLQVLFSRASKHTNTILRIIIQSFIFWSVLLLSCRLNLFRIWL